MNPLEIEALLGQVTPLSTPDVLRSLLLALALGLSVAGLHRFSKLESSPSAGLLSTLALLPPIGSLVMMVIGNSLARAFSLVGALAIIRFRTRLRSPWDITFIFLSLAVGVGCGVGAHEVAILGTLVVGLAVLVLGAMPGTRPPTDVYSLRCEMSAHQCGPADLEPILQAHVTEKSLSEARTGRFGEALTMTWTVNLRPGSEIEHLLSALSQVEGVERATLIANADALGEEA
jgi:hypothetical protein